jgi:Ca2+-binding EF-hand superfamily protein
MVKLNNIISISLILNSIFLGDWSPFNIETVRLMLNMFDDDHSGTITFNEFQRLWEYIEQWKSCFQRFDADQSGTIDGREMGEALRAFGFNLSPKFINLIILKFDSKGMLKYK